MPVSKKAKSIYNAIFDGSENFVANVIQKIQAIICRLFGDLLDCW